MRKGNNVVVLSSSDDEDDKRSLSSNRSYKKPKARSLVTRTNPRLHRPSKILMNFLTGSRYPLKWNHNSGSGRSCIKELLWVDKYKPRTLEELAVHKKKVEEVKTWFEERLRTSKDEFSSRVLVISGPAGVGKSATVHMIASHLGAKLHEWNTPTPTIWQEHAYNFNAGISRVLYTSKLDEFENFVEKVRKYGLITSSSPEESKASIILVIDDIPVTNGRIAFERLKNCLLLLVRSTLIPTAVVVTDCGKADSGDHAARSLEELQTSLENAGACKVAFNPITSNSIKKTLLRICRQEQCGLTAEQIDLLAKASGGDIRHAISSLQFFCRKPDLVHDFSSPNYHLSSSKGDQEDLNDMDSEFSMQFGRDETLSLFHALGKFLHNKRETENVVEMDQDAFLLKEKFSRLPWKMDTPEKVLCQAHGQARPIADFLHENVLDFLSEDAMDDAWLVASYLGDADLLLASFRGMLARYNEAENVLQSAAASVAVRGVLFGNSHPLPSRWHAILKPKLWQVEQSSFRNKKEMVKKKFIDYNGINSSHVSVIATEYTSVLKWLENRTLGGLDVHDVLMQGNSTADDSFDNMSLDEPETEISDDEIEDW
ncbi:hypothetical protein Patl1_29113 [Pistacia atlantica]|uniref:Uncharacterized protein n=1 Tax=Pistacia atlantica TaxID=434234 RepID=A0ACC1BEV8_9ROSI|nr:hypothetical protein Patl1_29113 [Pistacia atlantica]